MMMICSPCVVLGSCRARRRRVRRGRRRKRRALAGRQSCWSCCSGETFRRTEAVGACACVGDLGLDELCSTLVCPSLGFGFGARFFLAVERGNGQVRIVYYSALIRMNTLATKALAAAYVLGSLWFLQPAVAAAAALCCSRCYTHTQSVCAETAYFYERAAFCTPNPNG